jgi:hypothetical protein
LISATGDIIMAILSILSLEKSPDKKNWRLIEFVADEDDLVLSIQNLLEIEQDKGDVEYLYNHWKNNYHNPEQPIYIYTTSKSEGREAPNGVRIINPEDHDIKHVPSLLLHVHIRDKAETERLMNLDKIFLYYTTTFTHYQRDLLMECITNHLHDNKTVLEKQPGQLLETEYDELEAILRMVKNTEPFYLNQKK